MLRSNTNIRRSGLIFAAALVVAALSVSACSAPEPKVVEPTSTLTIVVSDSFDRAETLMLNELTSAFAETHHGVSVHTLSVRGSLSSELESMQPPADLFVAIGQRDLFDIKDLQQGPPVDVASQQKKSEEPKDGVPTFWVAPLTTSQEQANRDAFVTFVLSAAGQEILAEYGFHEQ